MQRQRSISTPKQITVVLALCAAMLLAGCGSTDSSSSTGGKSGFIVDGEVFAVVDSNDNLAPIPGAPTLKVMTHDSFAVSQGVLDEFTAQTGVKVELIPSGDAVAMTNAAILTAGNPVADVLFGIDENLLAAAFDANLFVNYVPTRIGTVDQAYVLDDLSRVTPIDHGDVCVNFDREALNASGTTLPTSFADLAAPALNESLVVEDPSASTPGLAFMLATIASFGGGDDASSNAAWLQYWKSLKDNGVQIVDSWESAYYGAFSGGSGEGTRPLVVSYASSPPAEVTDTTIAVDSTPTGVIGATCYRQTEFAGILAGSTQQLAAASFIEFMLGKSFQEDVPGQMYVYPVRSDATLPEAFVKYTTPVEKPLSLSYEEVGENRDRWIKQWSSLFR
jgi:thiamine transport system substrate-binding protein